MSLRVRLALAFAGVALATAAAVAIATPFVVNQGFARLQAELAGASPSPSADGSAGRRGGAGGPPVASVAPGAGRGLMAGQHLAKLEQDTSQTLILVALGAAIAASIIGAIAAGRLVRPLRRLERASAAVARGELGQRSGLADRGDELGQLGRSFDTMAAELQRSDELRRRFLQDAAHELRTPLAVIDATASAVLDGVYAHEDRHLQTIRDQSRLLARIVDDLRTISLAEGGALTLRREAVSVADLVREAAAAQAPLAADRGVTLLAEPPEPGLLVEGDRDRLAQVVGALLDNAIRHTPAGGQVRLAADRAGDRIRLEVADTGRGIAPADLPHLFDRFYQADPSRDRATGTSGLGLAIVRALVEAHGGRVGAANRPAGGAVFWLELRAARPGTG